MNLRIGPLGIKQKNVTRRFAEKSQRLTEKKFKALCCSVPQGGFALPPLGRSVFLVIVLLVATILFAIFRAVPLRLITVIAPVLYTRKRKMAT